MTQDYISGLDLGQRQDFTALAVLQRSYLDDGQARYDVRSLKRFKDSPYPEMVDKVCGWMGAAPLPGSTLVVDQTGVGRPVVDLFARAAPPVTIYPVTITAGHQWTRTDDGFHVPKKELASVLQVLLGTRRLGIPRNLDHAAALAKELQSFQVKITAAGNETFEAWRERDHDDLVLAVALAAWVGENQACAPWAVTPPDTRDTIAGAPRGVFADHQPKGYWEDV